MFLWTRTCLKLGFFFLITVYVSVQVEFDKSEKEAVTSVSLWILLPILQTGIVVSCSELKYLVTVGSLPGIEFD